MNKLKGFSYIEILVTLCLIGLLSSAIFPIGKLFVQYQKEKELKIALQEVRSALDQYKYASDRGLIDKNFRTDSGYPPNLEVLLGVPSSNQDAGKLRFLRHIPKDPFKPINTDSNEWGLRSFSSEVNFPRYENDVYDIYSKSELFGSNKIKYKDW
ncbi:type II secretion system protein [Acinetobacter bereziniae]|uniref:type II secretion system protein n=1 Tax=Acinetobacter bereziniae TaxID=106648 RepID=UPI0019009423|nr:type II secretion system protein [Acinetobacter bereziniae]MBJ8553298.1 type II secretion system protein [Acinetobacter bereziniae]